MATVLHLLGRDDVSLALAVIRLQIEAGDQVEVAVLNDHAAPVLPSTVTVHRVPRETSYSQLLDLIFTADRVVTW